VRPTLSVMTKIELSKESVPPFPLLEGVLQASLESIAGGFDCLRNPPTGLSFSENVAATYWLCRNELLFSENLRRHNPAVFNPRHRWVVRMIWRFVDELRSDDLCQPAGTGLGPGVESLGPVSGEDDPRALWFVRWLIDFMTAYHLLFHADSKPFERSKVYRLFCSGELSEHKDWVGEVAKRIEGRKKKASSNCRAAAV